MQNCTYSTYLLSKTKVLHYNIIYIYRYIYNNATRRYV